MGITLSVADCSVILHIEILCGAYNALHFLMGAMPCASQLISSLLTVTDLRCLIPQSIILMGGILNSFSRSTCAYLLCMAYSNAYL